MNGCRSRKNRFPLAASSATVPGMGFYATDTRSVVEDLPPKNRVMGSRRSPALRARRSAAEPVDLHQETRDTSTKTVSGLVCWLSRDPLGEVDQSQINLYLFVLNNPVLLFDILGLDWTVEEVAKIMCCHKEYRHVIEALEKGQRVVFKFDKGFLIWEKPDGTTEKKEEPGLRGEMKSWKTPQEIYTRGSLSPEEAAANIAHETFHVTEKDPAKSGKENEIRVRVATEQFRIRNGMPPTKPGYRKKDGTVDEDFIRKEVEGSPVYNPAPGAPKVIGTDYEGTTKTTGWRCP